MEIQRLEDKCNCCMLCVKDCATGVWRDVDNTPTVAAPELCNRCAHCVAVCPRGAIKHDALDAEQVRRADKKTISPEAYREIAISRRSVRHYKDKAVPKKTIEKIIDLARYSPTASNDQNVKYIVVSDKKALQKISKRIYGFGDRIYGWSKSGFGKFVLKATGNANNRYLNLMDYTGEQTKAGRDYILHNAPALILLHAPKKAKFGCDNCNIAATNIINYAHSMGLGACYIGFLTLALRYSKTLRRRLNIPEHRRVYVSLVMGYPAYTHAFTVSRKKPDVQWIE